MPLFKLTLKTTIARNTYLIFLLSLVLLPLVLPYMTPWEEKSTLLQPARAQAAWSILWLVSLVWLFYQAAIMGHDGASQGVLEYFKTLGMKRRSQLMQLWVNSLLWCLICVTIVLALVLLFAMPGDPEEAKMWVITNLQYAILYLLVVTPLFLLATALGTRINETAAYVITVGMALYGLYGIGYLDFFLSQSGNPVVDTMYVISPHYHLADLTTRLVYKMGPLESSAFIKMVIYFLGLGMVVIGFSSLIFRTKK